MADAKFLTIPHLDRRTIARIFSKIVVEESGCWFWTGEGLPGGYGKTTIGGRKGLHVLMHRLMFAWLVGPIPMGRSGPDRLVVHHRCNVKRCCNPSHLDLVQHAVNVDVPTAAGYANKRRTTCPKGHRLPLRPNRKTFGRRPSRFCSICNRARVEKDKALARYAIQYLRTHGIVPSWNGREFVDQP